MITGSIDGKIRIWEARRSQVIDWIEIRDLVTAICYYANGKVRILAFNIWTKPLHF